MKRIYTLITICFLILINLTAKTSPIFISEVFYDSPYNEDVRKTEIKNSKRIFSPSNSGEFIELYNPTLNPVDISDWSLTDEHPRTFKFPNGTIIPSRSTIILVYRGKKIDPNFRIGELFPQITLAIESSSSVIYHSTFRLTNQADRVQLKNQYGELVDEVSYQSNYFSKVEYGEKYWNLKARNGENMQGHLLSLQRKNLHNDESKIYPIEKDWETRSATPLEIPTSTYFPILDDLYDSKSIDKSLNVGTTPGAASVTPTGAASYQIPLEIPIGTKGMHPQLSVVYNSQGGTGSLGVKWDIGGISSISRGDKNLYYDNKFEAIKFDNTDPLYLDGQRLILLSGTHYSNDAVYATEVEDYSRVYIKSNSGGIYFQLITKEGIVLDFGKNEISKIKSLNFASDDRVLEWKLTSMTDIYGNGILYSYNDRGNINEISYNIPNGEITPTIAAIKFNYIENSNNPKSKYITDFLLKQDKLLDNISIATNETNNKFIKKYEFKYNTSETNVKLTSVMQYGLNGSRFNSTKISWGPETKYKLEKKHLGYSVGGNNIFDETNASILSGDVNGDGYPDLIEFWGGKPKNNGYIRIYPFNKTTRKIDFEKPISYTFGFNIDQNPSITLGDINDDGKDEIIFYDSDKYIRVYKLIDGRIVEYNGNIDIRAEKYNFQKGRKFQILICNVNGDEYNDVVLALNGAAPFLTNYYPQYTVLYGSKDGLRNDNKEIKFLYHTGSFNSFALGDFNADSKLDFLGFAHPSYSASTPTYNFDGPVDMLYTKSVEYDIYRQFVIDFNNDGCTDILIQRTDDTKPKYRWELYTFKNLVNFMNSQSRSVSFKNIPNIIRAYKDEKDARYHSYCYDYNGDGLADLITADEKYTPDSKEYVTSYNDKFSANWYFYKNTGNGFELDHQGGFTSPNRISETQGVVMDVNGDGHPELVFLETYFKNEYSYFTMSDIAKQSYVHTITNGMGKQDRFTYKNYGEFQSQEDGDIQNLNQPVMLVESYIDVAGNEMRYEYKNGKVHKRKGFIGFEKIITKNNTTKSESISEYEIDSSNSMRLKNQKTTIDEKIIDQTDFVNNLINLQNRRYIPIVTFQRKIDYIRGVTEIVNYTYNDNGFLVEQTTRVNNEVISTNKISDFKKPDKGIISYLPGTVTLLRKRSEEEIVKRNKFEYYSNGDLKSEREFEGTSNELFTEYEYYPTGNIKFKHTTPKGLKRQTVSCTYDKLFRYIEKETNSLGHTTEYKYDYYSGKIISKTDFGGFTTTFKYNDFNQLIEENLPNGEKIQYILSWTDEHNAQYKKEIRNTKLNKTSVVYYNHKAQEIYAETTNWKGKMLISSKEYDHKGQVTKIVEPHLANEPEIYKKYHYDYLGRVSSETVFDGVKEITTSYNFDKLTTKVTKADGKILTSIEDATGLVVERIDNGGIIKYKYNAIGNPIEIKADTILTKIKYDEFGNQTDLYDPNAGHLQYSYYSDGRIRKQISAKGDSTVMIYDEFRRLKLKKVYDVTKSSLTETAYSYISESYGIGQVSKIVQSVDGKVVHSQNYSYNVHHSVSNITELYENKSYNTKYIYDDLWRVKKTISPSGLELENKYDEYGFIYSISNGTNDIWELDKMNGKGQITKYTLGNGTFTNLGYSDNGILQSIQTANGQSRIQDLAYEYNNNNYNLERRVDYKNNRNEAFIYDNLDRLTNINFNGVPKQKISYDSSGNIQEKTDVGKYLYESNRPHAMSGIQGELGEKVTKELQNITYTAFNKVSGISQDNDSYIIEYGLNDQRIKTTYNYDDETQLTRYYFGTYEKEIDSNGNITHIDYIYTPSGLTAISKKKESSNREFYYLHTDNLGSIQAITNSSGNIVSEFAYEAWGARILLNGVEGIINRGYTGHEHLEPLGLINMNGRIYDPTLARFLSPDPYVQAPDFTQGFNRYAYCLNNPFKYTDPSGESVIGAIAIGAAVGAIIGGVTYTAVQYYTYGSLDYWQAKDFFKSVGVGALSGAVTAGVGQMFGAVGSAGLAGEVGRAFVHATTQASIGFFTETSDFLAGFASGFAGSLTGSLYMMYMPNIANTALGTVAFSTLAGGVGAELSGGDFWFGAGIGFMNATLNHLATTIYDKIVVNRIGYIPLDEEVGYQMANYKLRVKIGKIGDEISIYGESFNTPVDGADIKASLQINLIVDGKVVESKYLIPRSNGYFTNKYWEALGETNFKIPSMGNYSIQLKGGWTAYYQDRSGASVPVFHPLTAPIPINYNKIIKF